MYFDEFKHQLPDIDPDETSEWLGVARPGRRAGGREPGAVPRLQAPQAGPPAPRRAAAADPDPLHQHDQPRAGAVLPGRRGDRAPDPADHPLERGRDGPPGQQPVQRASAATSRPTPPRRRLYEVGLQPLLPGQGRRPAPATRSSTRATRRPGSTPGRSSRAGSARTSSTTSGARRVPGEGLSSYPHPRLMPDFWEFPTVSMGLGPISAVYQARFNRYLQNRGLLDTSGSRVWAFLGDGETDEPEALGALHVAAREGLDNLTFVVNCNLQRLDGPVRGNGKIIQELESVFRGAGWNVIKVIWAREWDELLARDVDGVLVEKMNDTLDGEFQKFSVAGGAYIREHFFGPDPRLRKLVEHLTDDDLAKLRRGGHDYRKVYAAYKAATEHKGAPTVILAKTVKGWTLGPGVEARNITHQAKKLSEAELKIFRDRLELPIPDAKLKDAPYYHPGPDSEEVQYLRERRAALGGSLPKRVVRAAAAAARRPTASTTSSRPARATPVSTTMVFTRILRNLIRDPELGPRIVPIIPDEARTFGMDPLFKEVGIYAALGQRYEPVDSELVLSYREAVDGQVLEEGITEAGSMARFQAAATSLRDPRPPDDPVLHLLLDVRLPADRRPDLGVRRRPRPRLPAGRDRRPDDAHRRGPPARRRPQPPPRLDHPERPRLRPGLRLRARGDRPRRHRADVREGRGRLLLRHALQRELRPAAEARGRRRGDPPRASTASRGAGPRVARPTGRGSSARARSCSRSSRPRSCSPSSSGSPPRSTPRRRSRCSAATRSRPSAGTGSIPTRSRASRTSRRSSARTAGRSSPRPTG